MSPLDPAFWLHHCNVDRLWAEWQMAGNVTDQQDRDYAGQFIDAAGAPVPGELTADNARDFQAMGFTYDTLSQPAMAGEAPVGTEVAAFLESALDGPATLASVEPAVRAVPEVATEVSIAVPDLLGSLFRPRVFRPTGAATESATAVESARILARLTDVRTTGAVNRILTNVFVNCPYLTPQTPYTDPHFADSFGFFMPGPEDGEAMPRSYVVDITEPLRRQAEEGRIRTEDIRVQLMPVGLDSDTPEEVGFTVGAIEIVAT